MDCERVEELLSDHREGSLHQILLAEVDQHLVACAACAELRAALDEVVRTLHAFPTLGAPTGLVERAARAALTRSRPSAPPAVFPAFEVPSWVQAAAAGLALIALGTMLLVIGPERPARAAQRIVNRTLTAGSQLVEKKDRLVEDVRILGVVLSAAFEGRVDRVNERVEDYRRLIERRRAEPADTKRGSQTSPGPVGTASRFRTAHGRSA